MYFLRPILFIVAIGVVSVWLVTPVSAARAPASFSVAQELYATSSAPGNAYAAGTTVVLTAPVAGDFSAFGGSVITASPVLGDDLIVAGSLNSRALVGGDVRAFGGTIVLDEQVKGDVVALGYKVDANRGVGGSTLIVAVNVTLMQGATGPVHVYANNVSLDGRFDSNVSVYASGRVTLASTTVIHGTFSYEAPEPAVIPEGAVIDGGAHYTNASYLPNIGTSRVLVLLNMGFFLFVRFLGALLLAGLLAGLFPKIAAHIVGHADIRRPRSILLTILLGFGILVATPILCILLLLTFVGVGLALLLALLYALLFLLSLLYAGILVGGVIARKFFHREHIVWWDGVLGMMIVSGVTLIPFIGIFCIVLFSTFVAGTLLQLFFHFAFPGGSDTIELV